MNVRDAIILLQYPNSPNKYNLMMDISAGAVGFHVKAATSNIKPLLCVKVPSWGTKPTN